MRRIILCIIIILSNACYLHSQSGWIQKYMGSGNLVSINFINSNTGYIFRSNKVLFKSTNKGSNWDSTTINAQGLIIWRGVFTNESIGAFIPFPGVTTNGGVSWNQGSVPSIGSFYTQSIYLLNDSTAFISGVDLDTFDPCIYKSVNAGLNWFEVDRGGTLTNYSDIMFINDNTGFLCRSPILKSTDSGLNWFYLSSTSRQTLKFSKTFSDTFYISSLQGFVLKTTNLGLNWTDHQTGISDDLNDIFFFDNQTGYCVGSDGGIVKTTNGGVNWIIQNSGTKRKLNEVWFINEDTGFIAGDSGLLLVTYNGGVTSINQSYGIIPENFVLHQNYPNPFNPATKIKFDLPKAGLVSLKIFNLLGQQIAEIVNQNLNTDVYEYSFDGTGLPSGVYFYRLETGGVIETKSMVLIK